MKKGIRGHDINKKGLKSLGKRAKEVGIEYLQLVLEKSIDGFSYGQFSEEYAKELKAELGDTKIAVLGSYINPSNTNEEELKAHLDAFKEKIKYASFLNPIVVGTETGTYIDGKTHTEEAYQYVLGNIKELVAEAEKYGVTVGIEGVHLFVIDSPEIMARLLKDVDSPNIKVIFDPCNLIGIHNYKNQDEIINKVFDLLSDKLTVLHAKDFIVENGEMKSVHPKMGLLNYELIFKRMKEKGLDLPIICEEIDEIKALEAFERLKKYE